MEAGESGSEGAAEDPRRDSVLRRAGICRCSLVAEFPIATEAYQDPQSQRTFSTKLRSWCPLYNGSLKPIAQGVASMDL